MAIRQFGIQRGGDALSANGQQSADADAARITAVHDLRGVVQGVGFRPAVFRLARAAGLTGWIQNRSGTVRLALQGPAETVDAFIRDLPSRLPPNCRLQGVEAIEQSRAPTGRVWHDFRIIKSEGADKTEVSIPADLAICADCLREIGAPDDRRYGYPFTTCTNCGPRYTVVVAMPYDREQTTLARFPLCEACRREYDDVSDRRFHAESTACPACGPHLIFEPGAADARTDALQAARHVLATGGIVAVRGVGGYLLAADAFNRKTLETLRDRKHRPHKPFAIMAGSVDTLRRYGNVSDQEAELLQSPEAPIVILDIRPDAREHGLPLDLITPDADTLGAMLPTSPLHHLLLKPLRGDRTPAFELLLMTSGNRRGEPICITNEEARERLRGIADGFLSHDREINLRNDDSLCVIRRGAPQVWRRARGYAPHPLRLTRPLSRPVLAMGAELKNAIALGFGETVVLSPHVGDLDTPEAVKGLEEVAEAFPRFLDRTPSAIAVDLHPDMHSSMLGATLAAREGLPLVQVQHHHAHGAACLAENGKASGLALIFDGTGLGTDGNIWGAELLDIAPEGCNRLATFAGVPLPGGDAAVLRPARQLVARWWACGVDITPTQLERLGVSEQEVAVWIQQCAKGINAPITHAAGRVFDSFSALLGLAPAHATYDGQAAIRLEAAAKRARGRTHEELPTHAQEADGLLTIDWSETFRRLSDPRQTRGREEDMALAFHQAVAKSAMQMVAYAFCSSPLRRVALSGGVFMNSILSDLVVPHLERRGVEVYLHRRVPPNDGGIALGQAVIAGA